MSMQMVQRSFGVRLFAAGFAVVALIGLSLATSAPSAPAAAAGNKYIGADKCKSCHSSETSGNQHGKWLETAHAKAFDKLATDEAKKIGKEKGAEDPQKADACLKCHVTAFGVPAAELKAKPEQLHNVQCEACHGPGENHMKARFAAAAAAGDNPDTSKRQVVPEGEIKVKVTPKDCKVCHNDQSPTFKPFCFHERLEKIQHYDPRSGHKIEKPLAACPFDDDCLYKKGDCAKLPKKQ